MKRKQSSILFTETKRQNARANIRRFDWAREEAESILARADIWAEKSDEELWAFVPGHTLHRYIHVNTLKGCPACGTNALEYGAYEWATVPHEMPWKVKCPSCAEIFPKNDFGAFYLSGLDESGIFRRELADASLLFNADHPDPSDPNHKFGVDDGSGWEDFTFIPYYMHWGVWANLAFVGNARTQSILYDLSRSFCFTGEQCYAHKAAILLDRIADVYEKMDYFDQGDHGLEAPGGVFDSVWEAFYFSTLADAYDAIFDGIIDDTELVDFLHEKATAMGLENSKDSFEQVQANIEDNLLREGRHRIFTGDIWANATIHHDTCARLTLVLDDENRDRDLNPVIFEALPILPRRELDRKQSVAGIIERSLKEDGSGYESINYHTCFDSLRTLGNLLAGDERFDVYRLFPQFEKFFDHYIDTICIERYYPHLGDSWNTGGSSYPSRSHWARFPTIEAYVDAFRHYRNPRHAQFVNFLCQGDLDAVHGDIFEEEPDAIREEIREVADDAGRLNWESQQFTGFGLVILRSGEGDSQRAAWLSHAAPASHGHRDKMSIGMFAHGLNLMPDFGYPEYTGGGGPSKDKRRHSWTANTVSHNSVVVDQVGQNRVADAEAALITDSFVKAAIASGPGNYYATNVYRRALLLIDIDDHDSYLLDVFMIEGGNDHLYSFHSAEGGVQTSGLELNAREGTLAGEEIPFAELELKGSNVWQSAEEARSGYDYLYNIEQDGQPPGTWSVEWDIKDSWGALEHESDVRLKLTMLSDVDEVFLADGDPPQAGKGNPRRLKFVLAHRSGTDLESCFVSVIEPFRSESRLESISKGEGEGSAQLIEVEMKDGNRDVIVLSEDRKQLTVQRGEKITEIPLITQK